MYILSNLGINNRKTRILTDRHVILCSQITVAQHFIKNFPAQRGLFLLPAVHK